MKINAWYFDLDGTLYHEENGMLSCISERISEYIRMTLHCPEEEVKSTRERLFRQYGGTLPGLAVEYGSDYYASLRYVHDFPVEPFLTPNPRLHDALMRLEGPKYVFTSSWRIYAVRCLRVLGIADCFEGIIDAADTVLKPKPAPEAFQRALDVTGMSSSEGCIFVDDQPRNIRAAHDLGFFAVQAANGHPRDEKADAFLEAIEDIASLNL